MMNLTCKRQPTAIEHSLVCSSVFRDKRSRPVRRLRIRRPFAVFRDHNRTMKVIADLCVVPIGVGVSVSKEVAICERILAAAGLKTHLHAYGTNIEGDWDRVFAAVKQCHEALHAAGVARVSTSMRFGTRTDRDQTMEDKVHSVEEKLIL